MKAMLICGDRHWEDAALIRELLETEKPDMVIEGEARGADQIAGRIAKSLGIPVREFPAEWDLYGRAAGPIRNEAMLACLLELEGQGWKCEVVAYHDDIEASKGTKNMVMLAEKAGVDYRVVSHLGA